MSRKIEISCTRCAGTGTTTEMKSLHEDEHEHPTRFIAMQVNCPKCSGTGVIEVIDRDNKLEGKHDF